MPTSTNRSLSPENFRETMRRVPTPVTVVTAADREEARGATIGSFTSVSLEPPLISFNVAVESQIEVLLRRASHFAVHLLGEQQSGLCDHFAVPEQAGHDQLDAAPHHLTPDGTPILEEAQAVLHCRLHTSYEAGDHRIIVGRVLTIDEREPKQPLVYYQQSYRSVR